MNARADETHRTYAGHKSRLFGTIRGGKGREMIELELLGPSADGQSIVFTDSGGNRYEVLIDDKLRTVVRRDPNAQETSPLPDRQKLRPSDIQSLLRQGRGAHEIAALYDLEVEDVRRFESQIGRAHV